MDLGNLEESRIFLRALKNKQNSQRCEQNNNNAQRMDSEASETADEGNSAFGAHFFTAGQLLCYISSCKIFEGFVLRVIVFLIDLS